MTPVPFMSCPGVIDVPSVPIPAAVSGVHGGILRADRDGHVVGISALLLLAVRSRSAAADVTAAVGGATGGDRQAPSRYVLCKPMCPITTGSRARQNFTTVWARPTFI